MKVKKKFDKYFYYKQSVQSPKEDLKFFKNLYKKYFGKSPRIFREDFCGTFYLSYHWVKSHLKNRAIALDRDSQPLEYGKKHHLPLLSPSQKKRLRVLKKNILNPPLPPAEIISVTNFSYFVLKERGLLISYFKNIKKSLMKKGLFILDVLGGPGCEDIYEDKVSHEGFHYYWEQSSFNPINRQAHFHIHFQRKGEKKRKKVFSYDWRIWSLPELKEALESVGFSKVDVYWEKDNKKGQGSGIFKKTNKGDICEVWVAYLVCRL